MFNLLPGQGLGFSGNNDLAFGLAPIFAAPLPVAKPGGGGGGGGGSLFDNAYSKRHDDSEIVEILAILFKVIE